MQKPIFDKETWKEVLVLSPLKPGCLFGFGSGKSDSSWLREWKFCSRFGNKDQRYIESGHFLEYMCDIIYPSICTVLHLANEA